MTFYDNKYIRATSDIPVTFLGHLLGQTDRKRHRDLWGQQVGHGDL